MNEELGQQSFRTHVRGSACSFHMPWEDILEDLRKKSSSSSPSSVAISSQGCLWAMESNSKSTSTTKSKFTCKSNSKTRLKSKKSKSELKSKSNSKSSLKSRISISVQISNSILIRRRIVLAIHRTTSPKTRGRRSIAVGVLNNNNTKPLNP